MDSMVECVDVSWILETKNGPLLHVAASRPQGKSDILVCVFFDIDRINVKTSDHKTICLESCNAVFTPSECAMNSYTW